jgi:hypothetical protein
MRRAPQLAGSCDQRAAPGFPNLVHLSHPPPARSGCTGTAGHCRHPASTCCRPEGCKTAGWAHVHALPLSSNTTTSPLLPSLLLLLPTNCRQQPAGPSTTGRQRRCASWRRLSPPASAPHCIAASGSGPRAPTGPLGAIWRLGWIPATRTSTGSPRRCCPASIPLTSTGSTP